MTRNLWVEAGLTAYTVSLVLVLNGTNPHPTEDQASDSRSRRGLVRVLGLGVVTGAADDDCSAIGTYASAGAQFGTSLLWAAPVTFPMMFAVVYLSSKLGQVTGKGLFSSIKEHYSPWVLWPALVGVLAGNIIEAAADLGGMAAALGMFIHVPVSAIVIGVASGLFALQIFGSYELIRNVFRWLALALVAYIGSALLARPDSWEVVRGTFVPAIEFSRDFLSILVAIIGTTLSAYLYTWQSNVEVEEKIAHGQTKLAQRRGATEEELRQSRVDIVIGMLFSNLIMYFIVLSTAAFGMRGSLRKESRKQSFGFCARMPRSWRGTVAHVSLPAGAVLIQRL